jgi:hypothetical protein
VEHSPLNPRDAVYGGHTEAMTLHYKIKEGVEIIQYVDVMSLYPWVCKYFRFPVGNPVVHAGDDFDDLAAMLPMEGVIKCSVVAPNTYIIQSCRFDPTRSCSLPV